MCINWSVYLNQNLGEDRTTFITKIFKTEGNKPSPSHYSIIDERVRPSHTFGKMNKGSRPSTTWDAEFLSSITPSAKYIDIYTKVKKGGSMPDLK